MRRMARLSVVTAVLVSLAIAQAYAHGGGGSGGGSVAFHPSAFHPSAFHQRGNFVHGRGFARNRVAMPLTRRAVHPTRLTRTDQTAAFPGSWGGIWPAYSGDWWPGNGYQPVQLSPTPASQPQVIVINADGKARQEATDAMPDYGYIPGCHAIANGYHCDMQAAGHAQ